MSAFHPLRSPADIDPLRTLPERTIMATMHSTTPFELPEAFRLARKMLPAEIVIIASWKDGDSREINVQDFYRNGESFIPLFSSEDEFRRQSKGSKFEGSGVAITTDLFLSIMRGGEWLILDPDGDSPSEIRLPDR